MTVVDDVAFSTGDETATGLCSCARTAVEPAIWLDETFDRVVGDVPVGVSTNVRFFHDVLHDLLHG